MSNDGAYMRLSGPSGQVEVVRAMEELGMPPAGGFPGICSAPDGAIKVDVGYLSLSTGAVLVKVYDMSVDEDSPLLDDFGARERVIAGLREKRPSWRIMLGEDEP